MKIDRMMDLEFECYECKEKEIIKSSDIIKDGRSCKVCEGKLVPIAYIVPTTKENPAKRIY